MVRSAMIDLQAFSDEFVKIAAQKSKTRLVGAGAGAVGGGYATHKALSRMAPGKLKALLTGGGALVGGLGGREVGEGVHAGGQVLRGLARTGRQGASHIKRELS